MEHRIERAPSSRSKCRGCGQRIDRDQLRFGEQVENPWSDSPSHLWFHPRCAAYKRPEALLTALSMNDAGEGTQQGGLATAQQRLLHELSDSQELILAAQRGLAHRRLQRVDRLSVAPSGRASCRHCRERIDKGALRIGLVWFEGGKFDPSGYLHVACARAYCESDDLLPRLQCFTHEVELDLLQQASALLHGAHD